MCYSGEAITNIVPECALSKKVCRDCTFRQPRVRSAVMKSWYNCDIIIARSVLLVPAARSVLFLPAARSVLLEPAARLVLFVPAARSVLLVPAARLVLHPENKLGFRTGAALSDHRQTHCFLNVRCNSRLGSNFKCHRSSMRRRPLC